MEIGIDDWSYHLAMGFYEYKPAKCMTVADFFRRIADLGVDGAHIGNPYRCFEGMSPAHLGQLQQLADQLGLWVELGPACRSVEDMRRMLAVARDFGSRPMRTWMPAPSRYRDPKGFAEGCRKLETTLAEVLPDAERVGVRIALENHGDFTADEMLEIRRRLGSDFFGFCLDTGNPIIVMENPVEATRKLASGVYTTHIKDYLIEHGPFGGGGRITGVPFGQGSVEIKRIVGILLRLAPNSALNVEVPVEAVGTEKEALERENLFVAQSVDYLRGVLEELQ